MPIHDSCWSNTPRELKPCPGLSCSGNMTSSYYCDDCSRRDNRCSRCGEKMPEVRKPSPPKVQERPSGFLALTLPPFPPIGW